MTTNRPSTPKFSVVIPTVGRDENLDIMLSLLTEQDLKDFETILVFREIPPNVKRIYSEKYRSLKLVIKKQEGQGLVSARNTGLKYASGEFVVFTDDDVEPSKHWLSELYLSFKRDPKIIGATGPSLIPEDFLNNRDLTKFIDMLQNGNLFWRSLGKIYFWYFYENQPYAIGRWFKSGAFSLGANYPEKIRLSHDIEVMDLQACNFAVKRKNALSCHGFDSQFKALASYSESDFAFRLRTGSLKLVFNPKAIVHHKPSQGGVFKERTKSKSEIENYLLFYFRHIKISNLDNFFRFLFYFLVVIIYRGVYQSIQSRNLDPIFGVISGTISGIKTVLRN